MAEIITRRISGQWHVISARKERLVDSRGKVVAEVFQVRITGRWAYSRAGLMQVVGGKDEAKARAERG